MVTIAELAKDLNVSVQAIYKKINKTMKKELKEHIFFNDGQKVIDEQGIILIKENLKLPLNSSIKRLLNTVESVQYISDNPSINAEESVLNSDVKQFKDEFNSDNTFLKKQLDYFMEQNKKLVEELSQSQKTIQTQSSEIAEIANKLAELTRNGQILLKQEQERETLAAPQNSNATEIKAIETKVKKKSWLDKLLKK